MAIKHVFIIEIVFNEGTPKGFNEETVRGLFCDVVNRDMILDLADGLTIAHFSKECDQTSDC
jgi:hypothetical protein